MGESAEVLNSSAMPEEEGQRLEQQVEIQIQMETSESTDFNNNSLERQRNGNTGEQEEPLDLSLFPRMEAPRSYYTPAYTPYPKRFLHPKEPYYTVSDVFLLTRTIFTDRTRALRRPLPAPNTTSSCGINDIDNLIWF